MKRLLIIIAIICTFFSCTKNEHPKESQEDTPEEILLAVQNIYTVSSVVEKGQQYKFTFASVTPITLKKEYPEGIRTLVINKVSISRMTDDGKNIEIFFTSGKRALLKYDSALQVTFSSDTVTFSNDHPTDQISFIVNESKSEDIRVAVSGHESFSTVQTEYDPTTRTGTVTFLCTTEEYFEGTAYIEVSNEERTLSHKVSVSRLNFMFDDGTTHKAFKFQDYGRYFEIGLGKADSSAYVCVQEESAGWIKARMSNEKINGTEQTAICILLSGNDGDATRDSKIIIRKEGYAQELTIDISQIGSAMDGSFTKGLVAFYQNLDGSSWVCSENWCSDKPLFEWYGISACKMASKEPFGEKGFVYFGTDDRWNIDLMANNMRGEIPMAFWEICTCFEMIRISREYLPTSIVPDCLWHEGLYSLDLSYSFMNVPIASSIQNASNLHVLSLQSCCINGSIPEEITRLSHLNELNLRECGITGTLPAALGNLKELRTCFLDINMELGGSLPESFYEMESLTDFNIGLTKIGGKLSSRISGLHSLEAFYINGCEFEGTIPEEFGQLDNIICYDFDGNYFTEIPQFVRYIGYNCRHNGKTLSTGDWVGSAGFPLGVPYPQRKKADGRPDNYIVTVPDIIEFSEILVGGQPLKRPGYYVDYKLGHQLPFPVWANVKYGLYSWEKGYIDEMKYPVFPYADDLQYPANEYYYDGKDWRHPKLEYPSREYYYDGQKWVHDASCLWDVEYK